MLRSAHLVKGHLDKQELTRQINAGSGKAQLQTLAGESLLAQQNAKGQVTFTDGSDKTVIVDSANQIQ